MLIFREDDAKMKLAVFGSYGFVKRRDSVFLEGAESLSFAPVRKTTPNAVPYMQSACEPIRLAGAFFSWPHLARTPLFVIFPTYWKKV